MELDLQADKQLVRRYIEQRIRDYADHENLGPGAEGDPIGLITVGFYAEQGGYVNLVFDTRANAEVDGEWTIHIDNDVNLLPFPDWLTAYEGLWDGVVITVNRHDGTKRKLQNSDNDEYVNQVFGEMLTALMIELRADGTLARLPLAPGAFMVVEEFDGRYFWPTYDTRKTTGRIAE